MLRVKRSDLAERGVVRNEARVEGVRDGLPLLADGTAVDVANVVWATGFRQDFDWIDLPVFGDDGWPRGVPRRRRRRPRPVLLRPVLPVRVLLDAASAAPAATRSTSPAGSPSARLAGRAT